MAPPLKPLDPPAELPAGAKLHPRELAKAFAKIKNIFFSVRLIVVNSRKAWGLFQAFFRVVPSDIQLLNEVLAVRTD